MAEVDEVSDPLIGQTIADTYEISALIAEGGIGRVYRATDLSAARTVALKVLKPRANGDTFEQFRRRFLREAAVVSRLEAASTVRLHHYGELPDRRLYMVMEYIPGAPLSKIAKDDGPLPVPRVLDIAVQIARSLREAHALGVVHRDLKLGNVMIRRGDDGSDVVKVVDFGLVKGIRSEDDGPGESDLYDTITRDGVILGSPGYMAPEQIRDGQVDVRTDIYAFGVVLFRLLCGRPPFVGANSIETLMLHMTEEVPTFAEVDRSLLIPAEVEAFVRTCLANNPDKRFQSITLLLEALRDIKPEDHDTSWTSVPPPEPRGTLPPTMLPVAAERPRPVFLAVLALIVVLLVFTCLGPYVRPTEGEAVAPIPALIPSRVPSTPPSIQLTVTSTPSGATLWEGSEKHGQTPLTLPVRAGVAHEYLLELEGYVSVPIQSGPAEDDRTLTYVLERASPGVDPGTP